MRTKSIFVPDHDSKYINVTVPQVDDLVSRFRGKTSQVDVMLSKNYISRMALTTSRIPMASNNNTCLVDIGGTIFWVPIYAELLGYRQIIMVTRPGSSFAQYFDMVKTSRDIDLQIVDSDAELDRYPIGDRQVSCVLCFELLEHFAGDPMHFVSECNRILRPGGTLYLTTPNVLYYHNVLTYMFGNHPFAWSVYTNNYADRHNREYTPLEVKWLLEAAGFDVQLLETVAYANSIPVIRKFLGICLCLPAVLARRVDLQMREKLIIAHGKKIGPVRDRYPSFLYDLFGSDKVECEIRVSGGSA